MRKIMLVGRTNSGKTTFCQALHNTSLCYKKTQAIEFINNTIDTPGEYVENRSLYRALLVTSVEADIIILMQDCTELQCIFSPLFSTMFSGKQVIGVVSKIDFAHDENQIVNAERKLKLAGAEKIFRISSITGLGIEEIKEHLSS